MFGNLRFLPVLAIAATALLASVATASADAITSAEIAVATVPAFRALFGGHPGDRPVHTKGTLTAGIFIPSDAAAGLTRAPQFSGGSVPVLVRLSNFMGVPNNPDVGPLASPHGMAVKFLLPDRDTDLVAHSFNGFPVATPDAFLGFLHALADGNGEAAPGDGELDRFLAAHPTARDFLDAPKPAPVGWANESFFGVNAFEFVNADGRKSFGRYRITPAAGDARLTSDQVAKAAPDYLATELTAHLKSAPVEWHVSVQIADAADRLDDGSKPWPDDRRLVELGTIRITRIVPSEETSSRSLLFTPLNLTDGILPSEDPMLAARSRAYGASYRERMH